MGKWKVFLFYITLFLLIFAYTINANNYDFDLWARLIAGMGVIDGGHVLKEDFLSYTPVHTWWDHEWGSGVIFYFFLKFFGPNSLLFLQAFLFFGIFFIISKILKLKTKISPYNILFYFFAIMALMFNFNQPVRCHMFSFLLFTLFIYILELSRKGNNKPLFLIPIIILFWNNIHGGVVAGLGLIGMFALGEFLNKKPVKKYILTIISSIAVMFINPWGYDYIKFLLMANTMERTHVMEWWGLFSKFYFAKIIIFKVFMFAMLIIESISIYKDIKLDTIKNWYKNADKVKYIILLSTLYLAFTHIKLIPFFVIASCCYIYEDFYKLIEKVNMPKWKDKVVYSLILAISVLTISVKEITPPLDFNSYPVKEVEFLKINEIKGKLLVNFGLGSYASYKLYPDNLIFMDGRYEEVYYDFMIPLLKKFYLVNEGWDEILIKYTPDCMIIENYYPVYNVLQESKDWNLVYEGPVFGVFLPSNKPKTDYKNPSDDIRYYKNTLFNTSIKF